MLMSKVCGAANWHYDGEVAECWPIATAKAALTTVDAEDGDRWSDDMCIWTLTCSAIVIGRIMPRGDYSTVM